MSNIQPLTDYILNDIHLFEINEKNILGSRGEITKTYAKLIRQLWMKSQAIFSPFEFLNCISKYYPQVIKNLSSKNSF